MKRLMNSEFRIPNSAFESGLRRWAAEVEGKGHLLHVFDHALGGFVALDIVHKSAHEALGMLRRHHNAAFHLRLRHIGHYVHEVNHELCEGMCDDGEIGVLAVGHVFGKLYVELLFGGLLGFHLLELLRRENTARVARRAGAIFAAMRILCLLFLIAAFASCKPETYAPKPRGYARMDTPRHAYQLFDSAGFPYAFEYPAYGRITHDTGMGGMKPDNPYWMNIDFPELGGTFYLSYKTIDAAHPLAGLMDDTHEMSFYLTKRADYMNTPSFHLPGGVNGILYDVGGNSASAYQFFATDSTKHFLRGALYFNVTPNADSLRPVTEFLHTDMEHLIHTLRWK